MSCHQPPPHHTAKTTTPPAAAATCHRGAAARGDAAPPPSSARLLHPDLRPTRRSERESGHHRAREARWRVRGEGRTQGRARQRAHLCRGVHACILPHILFDALALEGSMASSATASLRTMAAGLCVQGSPAHRRSRRSRRARRRRVGVSSRSSAPPRTSCHLYPPHTRAPSTRSRARAGLSGSS